MGFYNFHYGKKLMRFSFLHFLTNQTKPNTLDEEEGEVGQHQRPKQDGGHSHLQEKLRERKAVAKKGKSKTIHVPTTSQAAKGSGKEEKKKREWKLKYRSNLKGMIEVMNEIELREEHINVLKKTPFWLLLDALRSKKLEYSTCQKKNDFVEKLIGAYRSKEHFRIGKRNIRLTREEVKLILGIQCEKEEMDLVCGSKQEVNFVKRRKVESKRLTRKEIKSMIKSSLKKNEKTDIEDVAKLLCMFLCVTFLFSTTGNTLSWAHLQYLDDLDKMKKYDWADAILKALIQSIERHRRAPRKVTGCVNLLLYWFCEHTKLVEHMKTEEIPRLLKWNITDMQKKKDQLSFDDIQHDKVLAAAIKATPLECALYGINSPKKTREDAESSSNSLEDDVGSGNVGRSGDGGSDNEEEEEEEEEEEGNDKSKLSQCEPEQQTVRLGDIQDGSLDIAKNKLAQYEVEQQTVKLGDTQDESSNFAKEPVLKSPETRDEKKTRPTDYQTPLSCPMETVVPETPMLSGNSEGLDVKENAYMTRFCARLVPPSLYSSPSAGTKSQDDSLSVVELRKKLEVTEVQREKVLAIFKEALGREQNLLEDKHEATKRVQELENILKEGDKNDMMVPEIERETSTTVESKSKENALFVQQLQNQYEETITILKEALAREEELLKGNDGATKRIEELENVLNERDDTNTKVEHLQKENERLDFELSFMQGYEGKRTIEKDLFVEKLQKKYQESEERLQHLQTENEKLHSEMSYLKSHEGTTNMLMRMGEMQVEKENLMIQHEETVAKLKEALGREKVILEDNNGAAKKIEELSSELSRLKSGSGSNIEASLQSTEKQEKERDKAYLQLKRVQKENDDNMVQFKHLHTRVIEDLRRANQRIQNLLKEKEQDNLKIEKLGKENDEKDEVIEKLKTSAGQSEELAKEEASKYAIKVQIHEEENTGLRVLAERNKDLETEMVVHEETQKARQKNSTQEETQNIQNSLYEHLKTRKRKQVQLDDYEYPLNIAKRRKEFEESINTTTDLLRLQNASGVGTNMAVGSRPRPSQSVSSMRAAASSNNVQLPKKGNPTFNQAQSMMWRGKKVYLASSLRPAASAKNAAMK